MDVKTFGREHKLLFKLGILAMFIVIFTGSDLLVKSIVEHTLRNIPEQIEQRMFESYIAKSGNIPMILSSYEKRDDGYYHLTITDPKAKHQLWKELRRFGFDKEVIVVKGVWSFIYETNEDIGFSILRWLDQFMAPSVKKIFLICLQAGGVFVIFLYYLFTKERFQFLPLALIISGALGNVIDRIMRGYVVDFVMWVFKFIPLRIFNPWPIFNLADVYTVCGAVILFVLLIIFDNKKSTK